MTLGPEAPDGRSRLGLILARARPYLRPAGLGAAALAALLAIVVLFNWVGPGPAGADTTVVFRRGAGVGEIAAGLQRAHVIRSGLLFRLMAGATGAGRKLRAGEYDFPAHASLSRVLSMMASGQIVRHWITVAEGRTSGQVLALLNASPVLQGEAEAPPEGSLLPETYEVVRGEERAEVLDRMRAAMDRTLAPLWAARAPGLPVHTPQEALILASIVERETALPAERPRIAAVYENRLVKGMRLEADPVVIYGISKGEPLGRGLKMSELQAHTPYNVYAMTGLPPTPIANPGRAAIEAVLHPARSDALYFVADGTGGHVFSATYEAHVQNVARWRQIEARRRGAPAHTTRKGR